MTKTWNIVIQVLMLIGQVLNVATPVFPENYQHIATGIMTIVQGIVAIIAHGYNPDGTDSKVAYVEE